MASCVRSPSGSPSRATELPQGSTSASSVPVPKLDLVNVQDKYGYYGKSETGSYPKEKGKGKYYGKGIDTRYQAFDSGHYDESLAKDWLSAERLGREPGNQQGTEPFETMDAESVASQKAYYAKYYARHKVSKAEGEQRSRTSTSG